MLVNDTHSQMLVSPLRHIKGKVELWGSALSETFTGADKLVSFTVSRAGDRKFFGYGITHELEFTVIEKDITYDVLKNDFVQTAIGVDDDYFYPVTSFYVTEFNRDTVNRTLTVKATDGLHFFKTSTIGELFQYIGTPETIMQLATEIASWAGGFDVFLVNVNDDSFDLTYDDVNKFNFSGKETLKEVLDDIAEATQTVYYMDSNNALVFKRLDNSSGGVLTISMSDYYDFSTKGISTLTGVSHITELGENLISSNGYEVTQYIRDNDLWSQRTDLPQLLDKALAAVGGLTLIPFNLEWRGNYLLEPADKITILGKDKAIATYVINDKFTYNGGLSGTMFLEAPTTETETANNPTSLGDVLNLTTAKVDKAAQEITLAVTKSDATATKVSSLQLTTDEIKADVTSVKTDYATKEEVTKSVSAKLDSESFEIKFRERVDAGDVSKVQTTTKNYTFNDEGLNISSDAGATSTTITDDGMQVYRNNAPVLVANNEGVVAEDLHAKTYLIIGNTSRFEGADGRTTCYWIGGIDG